jgi:hypothetical protein
MTNISCFTWVNATVLVALLSSCAGQSESVRPELSRTECTERGGVVVGDAGDGAIHEPDYRCSNGEPPIGTVVPQPGEPIAFEGEVCCAQ